MLVIFDLDGTLADTAHREHFVNRPVGEKDWDGFHRAADQDRPKTSILRTYLSLQATGEEVEIWTGRDEAYRDKTLVWLAEKGIHDPVLRMRPAGDRTPDADLKSAWLDEHDRHVSLVFEDRSRVVQMYRDRGIICCQVAPGEF